MLRLRRMEGDRLRAYLFWVSAELVLGDGRHDLEVWHNHVCQPRERQLDPHDRCEICTYGCSVEDDASDHR